MAPRVRRLCKLAQPAKWNNPEWLKILLPFGSFAEHTEAMHSSA